MLDTVFSFFSEQSPLLQQNEIEHFAIGSGSNYRNQGVSAMFDSPLMLPHETRSEWAERLGCSDQYSANTIIENYFRTQMVPRSEKSSYPLPTEDISFGRTCAPQDNADDSYERYITRLEDIADDRVFAVRIASCTPESLSQNRFDEFIDFLFTELARCPRFRCESEDEQTRFAKVLKYPSDKSGTLVDPVKDIIMPNVLCTLLLEATYRANRTSSLDPLNLSEFMEKYAPTVEYDTSNASKFPLSDYPEIIKHLLGIEGSPTHGYEIRSLFPQLIIALILSKGKLPFLNAAYSTNWKSNVFCLKNCKDAIVLESGSWNLDSYKTYYLIELFFRLDTKCNLFLDMQLAKSQLKPGTRVLSGPELADFFFSSPLVYIPEAYISKCAYSEEHFHALVQFSYYWFPVVLTALRYYFERNGIFNYVAIKEKLLPICGKLEPPKLRELDVTLSRTQQKNTTKIGLVLYQPMDTVA